MSCQHRFNDILIPQQEKLNFLFIGTFNPSWDAANDNNATFFYGRASSLFWCILLHAFNQNCLIDKEKRDWESFCITNNIGLTDLISCVANADENNQEHVNYLTLGFKDDNLDIRINKKYVFNLDFSTDEIIALIKNQHETLRGVFLTRSTNQGIPRIWRQWEEVVKICEDLKIYSKALPTPSTKGGTIRNKIVTWRQEIQKSMDYPLLNNN